jgi:hypothetical protein
MEALREVLPAQDLAFAVGSLQNLLRQLLDVLIGRQTVAFSSKRGQNFESLCLHELPELARPGILGGANSIRIGRC